MSDTRTPDEIEREIEQNREGLQNTLTALQNTFSPESIFRSISDNVGSHGGDFGRSIGAAARDNPLALAVTGIGLGWLIFGQGPTADRIGATARNATDGNQSSSDRRERSYGEGASAHVGARGPVPEGDGPDWISDAGRGPSAGQRFRARWHRTNQAVSDRTRSARDGVSNTTGRLRDRSSEMSQRLSEGTENMGEAARERIVAARERAIHASEQASRGLNKGADRAVDFFDDHPLVAGAFAFAIGAAIAGSLPRSHYEDEHFGAESDRLYDEAERIFSEERAKAERVAGAALDEAKKVGSEVQSEADEASRQMKDRADDQTRGDGSAADAAVDRTEDAVRRVADAAESQAQKENLGQSSQS